MILPTITPSSTRFDLCFRLAAVALLVAGLGIPVNDVYRYGLLLLSTIIVFTGTISRRTNAWLAAIAIAAAAIMAGVLWPAPSIEEGHNVFISDGPGSVLERGLPADAFRQMAAEFNATHPAAQRCKPAEFGCWRGNQFPDRPFAFSTDSIYTGADYSRRVTGIDFSDPVRLRLGFINDVRYNWTGSSDLQRGKRGPWWNILHRWQLTMPYFVMYRFPAVYAGSELCWQGHLLWEGAGETFTAWNHPEYSCRPIEASDTGRRVFGLSIAAPLAMSLNPALPIQFRNWLQSALVLIVTAATLLLIRWRPAHYALPLILTGFGLLIVLLNDASFIGGIRPFDGGDDGLFYEGRARTIVQHILNGEFSLALEGGEKVFYYGGPGLRYLRAAEHFLFGDSFLGYLTLMLALPLLVFAAFRRFLGERAALALTLAFIMIPVGAAFGTTFYQYVKWAARGYADPSAAAVFLAGFIILVGKTSSGPSPRFFHALGAGLLLALALWLRPNLAPAAGILLGGAGLAALWQWQMQRVAGLIIGFLPVLGMALHNWVFGHVFVLFSSNANIADTVPMPPSAYLAAFSELIHLNVSGEHVTRGMLQLARWLSGPSESFWMIPLHAAAIVVLVRVAVWGRCYDPWLRLTACAMLAQHPVAFFYLSSGRYYYLTWLLTFLVCAVWVRDEGAGIVRRWFPDAAERMAQHPLHLRYSRCLDWWVRVSGLARAGQAVSGSA